MGYGRRQETQRRLKKVYQVGKYGVDYDQRRGYYCFSPRPIGTMRMLRDTKGQKTADLITVEERKDTAYAIFTPSGAQAQYAICSPIVDENGTLYFKNDSCFQMCIRDSLCAGCSSGVPCATRFGIGRLLRKLWPCGQPDQRTGADRGTGFLGRMFQRNWRPCAPARCV